MPLGEQNVCLAAPRQHLSLFAFTANLLSEEVTAFAKAGVSNLVLWQEAVESHLTGVFTGNEKVLFGFANN